MYDDNDDNNPHYRMMKRAYRDAMEEREKRDYSGFTSTVFICFVLLFLYFTSGR